MKIILCSDLSEQKRISTSVTRSHLPVTVVKQCHFIVLLESQDNNSEKSERRKNTYNKMVVASMDIVSRALLSRFIHTVNHVSIRIFVQMNEKK